jgi:hypothetical protein
MKRGSRQIPLRPETEPSREGGCDDASVDIWAAKVFGPLVLPDERLKYRALDCLRALARKPSDSIPQACGEWASTKGAYRFLSNERVGVEALREAACLSSAQLLAGRAVVLAPQDTTSFSMPTANATEGLGLVGRNDVRGYHLHSMLFLSESGVALGLAAQRTWTRSEHVCLTPAQRKALPIEEKESRKWFETAGQARAAIRSSFGEEQRPYLIHIFDREGDIHELFADMRLHGEGFVIRSNQDRAARDANGLVGRAHRLLGRQSVLGRHEIAVRREAGRPARKAQIEVRSLALTLSPRRRHTCETKYPKTPVSLTLVEAREVNCPAGQEAVHWLLWTSEPAATLGECIRVLGIYCKRWKIEDYHLTLKSGCGMEDLRLKTLAALEKALVLYGLIAVRIVRLRDLARETPDAPCTQVLNEVEWRVLQAHVTRKPPRPGTAPPSMRQAVLWIGKLGGHLGRKGDGMPGVRVLWKGLRDLELLVDYARFFHDHPDLLNFLPSA